VDNIRKRILVVDDEPTVRALAYRTLQAEFDVISAAYAAEALGLYEERRFDLIMTDGSLPGMSGVDLLELVLKRNPRQKCLMVSGTLDEPDRTWLMEHNVPLLEKPYPAPVLLDVIRKMLQPSAES
jgi:CheY-like chemotaxis protein